MNILGLLSNTTKATQCVVVSTSRYSKLTRRMSTVRMAETDVTYMFFSSWAVWCHIFSYIFTHSDVRIASRCLETLRVCLVTKQTKLTAWHSQSRNWGKAITQQPYPGNPFILQLTNANEMFLCSTRRRNVTLKSTVKPTSLHLTFLYSKGFTRASPVRQRISPCSWWLLCNGSTNASSAAPRTHWRYVGTRQEIFEPSAET